MLVYACNDLLFATKIAAAAAAGGLIARPARGAVALAARLDRVDDGKPNDAVAAVWVDLEREDALELIRQAAEHETAPGVVAFGPHVGADALRAAREAGADALPRGRFVAELERRVADLRG